MLFNEKLDFLMKLSSLTNSALGRALSFDASYISRIRSGKRGVPKNQPFVEPLSAVVARSLTEPYQRRAAAEVICPSGSWPEDEAQAARLLAVWLSESTSQAGTPVERLLSGLSGMDRRIPSPPRMPSPQSQLPEESRDCFYYGNQGKRDSVELFLTRLCALDTPQELLLYSDEEMSWLTEDPSFSRRWALLLAAFLRSGGQIRIIHAIRRNIGEMLEGVQKWLPLYLGGAIQSYYYPKLRDNVYRRTLFVARGQGAIVSTSVGENTGGKLNLLTWEPEAVAALEAEFMDYLQLCRPLMQVFQPSRARQFWSVFSDFERSAGDLIAAQPALSQFTLPEPVIRSMADRCESPLFAQVRLRSAADFRGSLDSGCRCTDILSLPPPELVRAGQLPVLLADLYEQPDLCYTCEEFRLHLRGLIGLLQSCENYRVVLLDHLPADILLFVKEDTGAFVSTPARPSTVFALDESRMVAALWEYACQFFSGKNRREQVIRRLETYLEQL